MIGYFVIILLAAGSVLAAALFFRHRQKQVMDGLSDMLEAAINGTFSETTFDESRQSSLENRLAQYLAASELSVRSIDAEREKIKELIADISHQTRTPLSNILLYTELLEEEPLGEAAQDSVKKLRQQSEKLQFLMDALVKLSRLETGVFVLHPIRQPLTELVVDGMESYREKAAAQGLSIAFSGTKKAEKDAPVYAYFDKKWSMEALENILDNAIKYTNTGGITIKLCSYELFACVEVTDTGIGIGEEEHAAVFGRFYRGNAVAGKERCGDRAVSGTFYHAAAGRIYPAFVHAGERLNVWAVFSNGNCVKTVRIFCFRDRFSKEFCATILKEGRKCQIRSKRRLQDGHFGNQRFEKTVWHGGDRRARAGGGKPVGGKRRICRGGRNLRIRKIDAFTYAWRTRPGNIRQSLCGRQGHFCIKG